MRPHNNMQATHTVVGILALAFSVGAMALTDLSQVPLTTSANNNNDPNLLYILDDSDSMNYDYMPDLVGRPPEGSADDSPTRRKWVGFRNARCNLVYYDPGKTYVVPKTSEGAFINDPAGPAPAVWGNVASSFSQALDDGFYYFYGGILTQVNLATSFKASAQDTSQPAYYWRYAGAGTLKPLDLACKAELTAQNDATTSQICTDGSRYAAPNTCSGAGKTLQWEKVIVSASSGTGATDERQNFANWYSYYRNRINLMKSASGEAFLPLNSAFRVGFVTIEPGSPVSASRFLKVDAFTDAHKSSWYRKLYAQTTNAATPLLRALSRAGLYFAGKTGDNAIAGVTQGITDDPMTSSCQQNFAFLTTDGYWNREGGVDLSGNSMNTNQDGNLAELDAWNVGAARFLVSPRPIYDGNTRYSWKTAEVQYQDNTACTYLQKQQLLRQWQTQTIQWQKTTVQNQKRTVQNQRKTDQLTKVSRQNTKTTVQNQKRTIQREQDTTQLQTRTTQLVETSTQLQKRSIEYQRRDVQWERRTLQLQRKRTQLQKTYTQQQKRTQQIKKQIVQYQTKIEQLQQRVQQQQKRTASFRACSGGTDGSGSCVGLTFDCASGTGSLSRPYCNVTNDTGWVDYNAACTQTGSETSVTLCRVSDTGFLNAGSCSASSTAYRTVSCQTITTQDWTNSTSCIVGSSGPNGSGVTTRCQATSDTGAQNAGSCSASDTGSGPTITCPSTDTGWQNAASCSGHLLDANGETISCQSTSPATAGVASCSTGGPSATGETISACNTVTINDWANRSATSCTSSASPDASGYAYECRTTEPAWAQGAKCTSATAFNSSGKKLECQEKSGTDTGWVSMADTNTTFDSPCSPSDGSATTKARECRTQNDSGWLDAGSCTATAANATPPSVYCQTLGPTNNNVGTCSVGPRDATGKQVTACTTTNLTWYDTGSCTSGTINAAGQTVECRTLVQGWSNIGICPVGPFPLARDANGLTVLDCRVQSDTTVNVGSPACSPSSPANGPIVTCIAGIPSVENVGATCTESNPASGPTVTCQPGTPSAAVDVASCTAGDVVPGVGPTITCPTRQVSLDNVGTCTGVPFDAATGRTITCPVLSDVTVNVGSIPANCSESNPASGPTVTCIPGTPALTNVASCSESNPASGPTVTCQKLSDTGWVDTGKCTVSGAGVMPTVTCQSSVVSNWSNVAGCTTDNAASPSVECRDTYPNGHQLQYRSRITDTLYRGQNQTDTNYGSTTGSWGSWTDLAACSATVPTVPPSGAAPAAGPPTPPTGCSAWPCETAVNTYGSNESLADVAQYYYKTDLRRADLVPPNCGSGVDLCTNNIKPVGSTLEEDKATWQHMVTFTLGLGVSGSLAYDSEYKKQTTAGSGDFYRLRQGQVDWPVPVRKSAAVDENQGLVNGEYAVDDLWHAAVNGRGQYFSASSVDGVKDGIAKAVQAIEATVGSATGAATTAQNLIDGAANLAFVATYKTSEWVGSLQAFTLDPQTGVMSVIPIWDAQAKLNLRAKAGCDDRTIKLFRSGATNNLVDFKQGTYACDLAGAPAGAAVTTLNASEQTHFAAAVLPGLSQYPLMSASQRTAAAGANLVNFLRGQRGKEGFEAGDDNKLFRSRAHVLGDIVYSAPVFVKAPFAGYDDSGYASFKANQASRTPMVYTGANDGMLHAFYAGSTANPASDPNAGAEAWAFIPTFGLPKLHKLASDGYSKDYTSFIDGTPVVNDVCVNDCEEPIPPATSLAVWKTILVSGLRNGGKGYFALDVTVPNTPKALWEFKWSDTCFDPGSAVDQFSDCHVGLSYGEPVIAKLEDGRWVVFVTSGYNNVNEPVKSGDGEGYLYVLEAVTGKILYKIGTGAGSSTNPSGLAQISARSVETLRNNTAKFVYGTDLMGNIWRFDVNNLIAPSGVEASLLMTVIDPAGTAQPITTKPQLGLVANKPWVYVGTGKYLGVSDLGSTQTQSIWGLEDPLTATAVANPRSTFKKIVTTTVGGETSTTAYRTNSCSERCGATEGWYTDLPASGERVNIEMKLDLGTLLVASNLPPASACEVGGSSWLNFFDASSGLAVAGSLNLSTGSRVLNPLGELTQVVGLQIIRTTTGEVKVQASTRQAGVANPYVAFSTPVPTGKRVSWREIITQ